MSRAFLILANDTVRARASHWCAKLPTGTRVEFKAPKRTLEQNKLFWSMLTDLAVQRPHHGAKLTPDDYKLLVLDALKREVRLALNLDGTGMVALGRSSSDLSKEEMSGAIEIMFALGARDGIRWTHEHNQFHTAEDGAAQQAAPRAA